MVEVDGNAGNSGIVPISKRGVWGDSDSGYGVIGTSDESMGVIGISNSIGVWAYSFEDYGIKAFGRNIGIFGFNLQSENSAYLGAPSVAGDFYNDIYVHGKITKLGGGFQIDDPRDPANKFLSHSFVESSDMKNIYDGVVVLDAGGKAEIELPNWFDEVNGDFRYQLTAIGSAAPNLYVEEEISENRFKIAGGKSGMKVSWQVTGIRKDPWANSNRIKVEEEKSSKERGYYLNPELFNESSEKNIQWARYPEQKQRLEEIRDMEKKIKNKARIGKIRQ